MTLLSVRLTASEKLRIGMYCGRGGSVRVPVYNTSSTRMGTRRRIPVGDHCEGAPLGPLLLGGPLPDTAAGFIDAAFLEKEGAKALSANSRDRRIAPAAAVAWLRKGFSRHSYKASDQYAWGNHAPAWGGSKLLRAYWYDGAFAPEHPKAAAQRRYFEAIAMTPGVHLRLGHVAEWKPRFKNPIRRAVVGAAEGLGLDSGEMLAEFDKRWEFRPVRQQKGVDTLIALDLVRLAGRGVIHTAVLVSGDRDLAETIRAAQDFGIEVLVATPGRGLAREVAQVADGILELTARDLERILPARAAT